jgi:hypothetical protein
MAGTQFHPEKSQRSASALIANFLNPDAASAPRPPPPGGGGSHDPLSRHRPEGRPVRAPEAGRHGAGDRLQHRSRRAGARLRGAGLRVAARRRSRRRLRRQAVNGAAVEAILEGDGISRAARRRHPRHGDDRGWLGKGVNRVILGTAAVRDPALVREAASAFPGRVAVGIDARGGKVAVEGWAETSELTRARSRRASRTPASPRSSTPTSTATAC